MSKIKNKEFTDLGLGTKTGSKNYRALNKDGSFNVKKVNVSFFEGLNLYHTLINAHWYNFLVILLFIYFTVNILFASVYLIIGIENLTGFNVSNLTLVQQFYEAFFFSAQTVTTLGYGRVAPIGFIANVVAAIESLVGLLAFALATGLLYGRFSKPSAKIKYSYNAVVAPYKDIKGFMFRVTNPLKNQLMEIEVNVSVSFKRENSDIRDFYPLQLERSKIVFFPSIWTIVHPISNDSPIFNFTQKELLEKDAEFLIIIKMFDESFSQTVYSKSSYKAKEVLWNKKFKYIIEKDSTGIIIDVSKLNETENI